MRKRRRNNRGLYLIAAAVLVVGLAFALRSPQKCAGGVGVLAGASGASGAGAAASNAEPADILKGKTIAFVPTSLGLPLTEIWSRVMRDEAERRGMKFEVRDPNANTNTGLQILSALIADKPDVLVVHNFNVQLYARDLKRAEAAGIQVIQVNMASNYRTASYVGADWEQVGRMMGEDIIRECGTGSGRSGKVSIVQGELTSGTSIGQYKGLMAVFAKDKTIQVVSSQAANWDATKAFDITTTVLQQHPDLCATVGFWGVMQAGAAQAVKAAGKLDQVRVYSSGGDGKVDCANVDAGLFYKFLSYDSAQQARAIIQIASLLLQAHLPPDAMRTDNYSSLYWMQKGKYDPALCYDWTRK